MRLIYCLTLIVLLFSIRLSHAETLYLIAHKGSFKASQKNTDIADYYLSKIKHTPLGQTIVPINLPSSNILRTQFSLIIFNRPPELLSEYWDRMSFRGTRPPLIQSSEQAVMLFVSRVKGAIGYVSKKPPTDLPIEIIGKISL